MEIIFLFGMVIGFLLLGVPIAISLGLSSIIFQLMFSEASLASMGQMMFQSMYAHYTLLAIPFFILASSFMSTGGVARRIIRFSIALVGHLRGGLAIAGVLACMMFAALSGSSPATVVAIGSIVIVGMHQVGYDKDFAAGIIAVAGTLGILIPPSIVMVVYASATDVSVGRMFLAGVIPGLLAGTMLMVGIYVVARIKNLPKGEWKGWGEVAEAMLDAAFGLFLMVIILGGIYGGIFTPTEAAAVASVYAFIVAVFIYRDMGPLKNRPWIAPEKVSTAQLGLRMWTFALFAFVSYYLLAWLYGANTWIALLLALGFSIMAFALGWIFRTRPDLSRHAVLIYVLILGVVPAALILSASFTSSWNAVEAMFVTTDPERSMAAIIGQFTIYWLWPVLYVGFVMGGFVLMATLFIFSLRAASNRLIEVNGGYAETVIDGGKSLLRGVGEIVIYALPTLVSRDTKNTLFEAGKLTVTLMFIIANALLLAHVLTEEQIPQQIATAMLSVGFGAIMFLVIVNIILLIGGQFMEPSGLIVIVAPLVFPIAIELGIDPIHLGIIMVVNMEIGMITPPVGLNLFVTSGVAKMPMMRVVRAALPWLGILFIFLIMVTYIPFISTVLPNAMMGPEIILK